MEVNRFLCFKKKKKRFLKLKSCFLETGACQDQECVCGGGRCRDWYLTRPGGLIPGCRGCWGQWGHLLGVSLPPQAWGSQADGKVKVGSLSSCGSWSEPRAHAWIPCFQKARSRPSTRDSHTLHCFSHGALWSSKPLDRGPLCGQKLQGPIRQHHHLVFLDLGHLYWSLVLCLRDQGSGHYAFLR